MVLRTLALASACLMLIGCSPKSRAAPPPEKPEAITAALESLSPWEDGSPDRSSDQRTRGDRNSDRQLFGRWYLRYAQHEEYTEHRRDYQPFPVPSTIGGAIEDERKYEAKEVAAQRVAAAQRARERAQEKAQQDEWDRQRQARDDAEEAAEQVRTNQATQQYAADQAASAAALAEQTRKNAAFTAAAEQRYNCRLRRQKAAADAQTANIRGANEDGVYQRVWDSFHCRED